MPSAQDELLICLEKFRWPCAIILASMFISVAIPISIAAYSPPEYWEYRKTLVETKERLVKEMMKVDPSRRSINIDID